MFATHTSRERAASKIDENAEHSAGRKQRTTFKNWAAVYTDPSPGKTRSQQARETRDAAVLGKGIVQDP